MAQTDTLPGEFVRDGAWLLQQGTRRGKYFMVFEFIHGAPAQPPLHYGWQEEPMTLEDVFIALVAKSDTAKSDVVKSDDLIAATGAVTSEPR